MGKCDKCGKLKTTLDCWSEQCISAASAGYVSQVDNADSAEFQLGIMRNVEHEISKNARRRFQNWQLVGDYLLQHTSKGGSSSCYAHCRWLGVDPEGHTFR